MANPRHSALRQAFGLDELPDSGPQRSGFFVWNLAIDDDLLGWRQVDAQYSWLPGGRQHLSGVWAPDGSPDEQGCRLELTSHPTRDDALEDLAQRLGDLSIGQPEARPDLDLGESAWSSADRSLVAWLHGNLVGTAAVVERTSAAPTDLALAVHRFLLQGAEPAAASPAAASASASAPRKARSAAAARAAAATAVGSAAKLPAGLRKVLSAGQAIRSDEASATPYPVPHAEMARRQDRPPMVRLMGDGGTVALGARGPDFVPSRSGDVRLSAVVGHAAARTASTAWHAEAPTTHPIANPKEST